MTFVILSHGTHLFCDKVNRRVFCPKGFRRFWRKIYNYQRREGIYLFQFANCNQNMDIDEEGERRETAKKMLGQNFGATLGLGCGRRRSI